MKPTDLSKLKRLPKNCDEIFVLSLLSKNLKVTFYSLFMPFCVDFQRREKRIIQTDRQRETVELNNIKVSIKFQ